MKKIFVVALVLLVSGALFAQNNNYGLSIAGIKLTRKGIEHSFTLSTDGGFNLTIDCSEDTGNVDIVFVLDTTGSMFDDIAAAVRHINEFADTMEATGYDYALGIVTYGDGFNFPHGYDLTTDVDTFHAWVSPIRSGGGDDVPEEALDAIMAAVDSMHWRPRALKVIILLTDACFCMDTSNCRRFCDSDWNPDTVARRLLDEGFMLFTVTTPRVGCSSCVRLPTGYGDWWYRNIAESTGGSWYDLRSSFSSIYRSMVDYLGVYQTIEGYVANNTPYTIDTMYAFLDPGTCITITYGDNPMMRFNIPPGDTAHFLWRVDYITGCTGAGGCFTLTASADSYSVGAPGCMYIPHCWCTPTVAENIWPETGVWSACNPQEIRIGIYDDDAGVDANTIEMIVNGTHHALPGDTLMFFANDTLTFTPPVDFFSSGDSVFYKLIEANDLGGCTLSTPVSSWFRVDLDPPQFSANYPADWEILGSTPESIKINIVDLHSGVDPSKVGFVVNGSDTHYLGSPGVTYSGGVLRFSPRGIYDWTKGDTIEICAIAADRVRPEYCGPNQSEFCWNFTVDYLYLYFVDTIVNPGDTIRYTLFCDDPYRFRITNFELTIAYNPSVVTINDILTTGTAAQGFSVSWDTSGGILRIVGAGSERMPHNIKFIDLLVQARNDAVGGSFTPMIIRNAVLNRGYIGYYKDDGTILLRWHQVQWMHHLIFTGYAKDGGYLEQTALTIGCANAATNGYDPAIDLLILPPPPTKTEAYLAINDPAHPAITRLGMDFRNTYDIPQTWTVVTVEEPGSLYWDPKGWPDGLITLNYIIDMKAESIYHYSANETLYITYSQPDVGFGTIEFCSQWNLLSMPTIITSPSWAGPFEEILAGPFQYDARTKRFYNITIPTGGYGFWLYTTAPGTYTIGGVPIDSISIPIYRGWNLVGSIARTARFETNPPGLILPGAVYGWDCSSGTYFIADPDSIIPGKGYWILSSGDGILKIKPR